MYLKLPNRIGNDNRKRGFISIISWRMNDVKILSKKVHRSLLVSSFIFFTRTIVVGNDECGTTSNKEERGGKCVCVCVSERVYVCVCVCVRV